MNIDNNLTMTSVLCPLMDSTAFIIEHMCIKITFYRHFLLKCILYLCKSAQAKILNQYSFKLLVLKYF